MMLESFRELLVKKTQDVSLQNLVRFMKADVLTDFVIESLEKMARSSHKGDTANFAVRDFGTEMDPKHDPNMIHDALSHHISHYKSALNSGNQHVANQHAKQIFRIMDMADRVQKHSYGKLKVEAVSPHAWERNGKLNRYEPDDAKVQAGSYRPGDFKTKTKGWGFRGGNYGFLQQAPHGSYSKEIQRHGHNNAYPLEEIKINGRYVDVEDIDPQAEFKPHPLDSLPIMKHFEEPAKHRAPERDKQYLTERDAFVSSPELAQYFADQEARQANDPEAHKNRGSQRAKPVHKQVDPLQISPELMQNSKVQNSGNKPPVAAAEPTPSLSEEEQAAIMEKLPPELRDKFARLFKK